MDEKTQRAKQAFELYGLADYADKALPQEEILALVNQGVDVKQTDGDGCTLLHYAAYYDHHNVCKLLIQQKANIHARDILYTTPLEFADINEKPEVVKLLLEWGANIWAKSSADAMPLDVDKTGLLEPHRERWMRKLDAVVAGEFRSINTPQDIYHLASVMRPENPKNVPPPKEFIRILFQQYLPHEKKFDAMYEEIFGQQRITVTQDLKTAREASKSRGVVL